MAWRPGRLAPLPSSLFFGAPMPMTETERGALLDAALLLFARLATLGPDLGARPHPSVREPVLGGAVLEENGVAKAIANGLDPSETMSAHTALARAKPLATVRTALESLTALIHTHAPICQGKRCFFQATERSWVWKIADAAVPAKDARSPQAACEALVDLVDRLSWCVPGAQVYHTSTIAGGHQEVRAASALDAALYWLATCRRNLPMGAESLARSGATTRAVFEHAHLYTEAVRRGLPT